MKTPSLIKYASISSFFLALLAPMSSLAENGQPVSAESNHNLVHRISYSLASGREYSHSGNAGYKWGKDVQATQAETSWSQNSATQSGYKWGNRTSSEKAASQSYASNAGYQWGSMSFSDQAVYRWGLRSFSEQSVYRWGLRSFSEQSVYRWGLRSDSDQSVYRWGLR